MWNADMKAGKRPPRADKNIPVHADEVVAAQAAYAAENGGRMPYTVLIGKSMGSRIGCHVAGDYEGLVDAVVCLGYPLVGVNGKLRDEALLALAVPTLLCQVCSDHAFGCAWLEGCTTLHPRSHCACCACGASMARSGNSRPHEPCEGAASGAAQAVQGGRRAWACACSRGRSRRPWVVADGEATQGAGTVSSRSRR